jgi:hypothetical protein
MFSQYFPSTVCFTHFSGRVLHRRCVLHFPRRVLHQRACFEPACLLRIFPGVFCTDGAFCIFSPRVLHQRACFEPAGFLRIFPGVFCTDGVFCIFSGRVLHRRGVLNQHAFYAVFRACFAPTVRLTFFPGELCTGGAFCGFPGIFLAVCAFYGFCRGVPHSRRVSRHGVFCPRACYTAQACATCRCVTHTRGVWH